MSNPEPFDEEARLRTLREYEVLDTTPEEAFDDLTLLAAHICQVPIAMVSLVDEKRQWFKSRIGQSAAELSRDIAFCAHTILHADQILEIRDAKLDSRFADNPMVTSEESIRFYAGAPLVAPDGHALGALCVMDRMPRRLSEAQLAALRALSRRVVGQLELRRQTQKLIAGEKETQRLLVAADRSRRALLSLLEDQKLVENALRLSEERFRQIADNIHEVFWMTDSEKGELLYISPGYETIWDRTCASLYAAPDTWSQCLHPQDRERVIHAVGRQSSGSYDEIYRILRPDNSIRWVRDRAFPVKDESGKVSRIVGVAEDITDRKTVEMRVELQHTITRILAEGEPLPQTARNILETVARTMEWDVAGLWLVDRASKVLRCVEYSRPHLQSLRQYVEKSREMTFAMGEGLPGWVWQAGEPSSVPEVTQDAFFKRIELATSARLRGAVAFPIKLRKEVLGVVELYSTESRTPDTDVLAMLALIGAQIAQFIERQELADQFRQAQKMEAIGTLAGGIAHDFNNVLGAISGYTEIARMELSGRPEVRGYLDAVMLGAKRATDLVKQILAFSRRQDLERRPLQLRVVVGEALKLLRATLPVTIEFEISMPADLPTVLADGTQVHQVVMNLCTNAAHAMRDRPGRLSVALETLDVQSDRTTIPTSLGAGRYVRLSLTDTGHGMDQATMARIFEPFFTTKGPGEGTGLGLSVVHGIMQSHDGAVTVHSHLGVGTTFQLYFPAHENERPEQAFVTTELPRGAGERILFVDDEVALATMGKQILERLGYVVESQTNPLEAFATLRAKPDAYDLVLTDQLMPGLMGTTLAEQIHELRPSLPIILTTGYSATLTPARIEAIGIKSLLLKPLLVETLATAVRSVLAKARSSEPTSG